MTSVARHGAALVRERLAHFEDVCRAIDDDLSAEQLHQLRIEGKKLRYTMEIMVDALPALAEPLLTLVSVQEVLGDLHDADVGLEHLRHLPLGSASERAAAAWLRERYAVSRQQALQAWSAEHGAEERRQLVTAIRAAARAGK